MQEINEGNVYNVQDVFSSKLNSSALGIKKVNKEIKSQLFDSFKRNKIQNKKEIVQKTFDGIFEANEQPPLVPPKGLEGVGNVFPQLSADNQTGAGVVVVTNPVGTSINKPSFGMGFELAPTLTASVQQFVNQYADKTDNSSVSRDYSEKLKTKFNLPPEEKIVTWQTMNNAVANHLNQNLKIMLQKYGILLPNTNHYENPSVDDQSKFNPTTSQNQSSQTTTPKSNVPGLQGKQNVDMYSRDYYRIKSKNKPKSYS